MQNPITSTQPHLTRSVIMVRPIDFGFNEQTGLDNEFQNRPQKAELSQLASKAMSEFESSVECLQSLGIEVLVLEKEHTNNSLPDAIFPNNWFSTKADGRLFIYPMKTKNRQDEVQISQLYNLLESANYKINDIIDLREQYSLGVALEGTGSLIFHHPSGQLFAAVSERCQLNPLTEFAETFGYQLTEFDTLSSQGSPIYHTNVLMSCGEDFAVITKEVISTTDRKRVIAKLAECVNDIVIISEEQMSNNFCGNILQLKDSKQQPVIALSKSAYDGFSPLQRKLLEKHGSLAICAIPNIERIGGGSTRCMLAENFL